MRLSRGGANEEIQKNLRVQERSERSNYLDYVCSREMKAKFLNPFSFPRAMDFKARYAPKQRPPFPPPRPDFYTTLLSTQTSLIFLLPFTHAEELLLFSRALAPLARCQTFPPHRIMRSAAAVGPSTAGRTSR